jgi:hypothetical protein
MKRRFSLFPLLLILLFVACGCDREKAALFFKDYAQQGGKLDHVRTLAILELQKEKGQAVPGLEESLAYHLRQTGCLSVIEPRESWRILAERGLHRGGEITAADAKNSAEALDVDALIYGKTVTSFLTAIRFWEQAYYPDYYYFSGMQRYMMYGRRWQVPYLRREGGVAMEFHVYDRRADRDMGALELKTFYNHDFRNFFYKSTQPDGNYFFDRAYRDPMPANGEMLFLMADRLLDQAALQLIPAYLGEMKRLGKEIPATEQARLAAEARSLAAPVEVARESLRHHIVEIKEDGRIYINAGEEDDVKPGDLFAIARYRLDFDSTLTTPRGGHFYRIGTLRIDKVFKGVSLGEFSSSTGGSLPIKDDSIWKIQK